MILFLYGVESFKLSQKLNKLTTKFLKNNSSGSSFEIRDFSENSNLENLESLINSQGLFSKQKMIILKNIFLSVSSENQKKIKSILEKSYSGDIIIICEHNIPRKNAVLFKWLLNNSDSIYEFKLLNDREIFEWAKEEIKNNNSTINNSDLDFLLSLLGGDNLYKLLSEIKKLAIYANDRKITKNDIELLVSKEVSANIFETVKSLTSENKLKALSSFKKQIISGDSPNKIHGMYVYQIRTMIAIIGECERGIFDKNIIAKSIKLHPYVVQKILPIVKKINKERLLKAHSVLLEIYTNSKIGKFDTETALEMFIMDF